MFQLKSDPCPSLTPVTRTKCANLLVTVIPCHCRSKGLEESARAFLHSSKLAEKLQMNDECLLPLVVSSRFSSGLCT
jgi:hypothetical protein